MVDRNNDAYRERMARRKEKMDARIEKADEDRGVAVVLTGPGKGKSSSAFGMVARAAGYGMKTGVIYFIKSRETGEQRLFERLPEVHVHLMGEGFTWETQDKERDREAAANAWQVARSMLEDASFRLVVLDEICVALKLGMLELEPVVEAVESRPWEQHVVLTGRGAPPELLEIADTASEVRLIRHAFQAGVRAQKGIEL